MKDLQNPLSFFQQLHAYDEKGGRRGGEENAILNADLEPCFAADIRGDLEGIQKRIDSRKAGKQDGRQERCENGEYGGGVRASKYDGKEEGDRPE